MLRIVLAMIAMVGTAAAQPLRKIEVKVDATVETEVGNLIGFACDHPKLLDAQMKTKKRGDVAINIFVVKGVAVGNTLCRIGNELTGGTQLFEVVIGEKIVEKQKR